MWAISETVSHSRSCISVLCGSVILSLLFLSIDVDILIKRVVADVMKTL